MKLQKNDTTTTKGFGELESQQFGVDTSNGVIFDILRNKMYSNKIAAVAREVSSNSRDANRENSKSETPIVIEISEKNLFTNTDMQIAFKDAGVGITPDRMANVFLNYGASTKRNTNKQTGGFGLGAKTPFAYSNVFTIVTICDVDGKRMKYKYTARITDKKGVGAGEMVLVDEEETIEETGTSIEVPIDSNDRDEFEMEVLRATSLWKTRPTLVGFANTEWKLKPVYKGKGFSILENEAGEFNHDIYLVIDGIPYEIDETVMKLDRRVFGDNKIIFLEYKNGELTISANREAVQYDKPTKIKLQWRIRQMRNEFISEINAMFAKQKSYLDACIFRNALTGHTESPKMQMWKSIYKWLGGFKQMYNGKELRVEANFVHHDIFRYEAYDSDGKLRGISMNNRKFDEKWQITSYIMDAAKRHTGKNGALMDGGGFILVVPTPLELKIDDKDPIRQKNFQEVFDKAIARQKEEMDLLKELGFALNSYDAVIPKVMPKGQSDSKYYRVTNDVGVPTRLVSTGGYTGWESNLVTFLRKEKATQNGKKYIYFITDKLSRFSEFAGDSPKLPTEEEKLRGLIAARVLGMQFVVVSEDRSNWFIDSQQITIADAWTMVMTTNVAQLQAAANEAKYSSLHIDGFWRKLNLLGRVSADTFAAVQWKDKGTGFGMGDDTFLKTLKKEGIEPTVTVDTVNAELKAIVKKYPTMSYFLSNSYNLDHYKIFGQLNQIMDLFDAEEKRIAEALLLAPPVAVPVDGIIEAVVENEAKPDEGIPS